MSEATKKPSGIVSFKLEPKSAEAARKICTLRDIPFSMWLREAAREKLMRDKKRKALAK